MPASAAPECRCPCRRLLAGIEAAIELPRFCELMDQRLALQEPDEVTRRAFRAFDAGAKGYISAADFVGVMSAVAPHLPRDTISLVFAEVDADRDGKPPAGVPNRPPPALRLPRLPSPPDAARSLFAGRVSYKDFHTMMTAVRPGHGPAVGHGNAYCARPLSFGGQWATAR